MEYNFIDNTIYYTIINKNMFDFKISEDSNENIETLQSQYLLKCMLNYFNIQETNIYRTKLGKPYFKKSNVFFNYSHSKNFIACAISNYNVGIDIEEKNRIITDTMIKICDFSEDDKLEELVKREAYCKLTGSGIAMFFDKDNFKNQNKKNIVIKNSEYICSIYSDCSNAIFEYINIK